MTVMGQTRFKIRINLKFPLPRNVGWPAKFGKKLKNQPDNAMRVEWEESFHVVA
jgi:hypothetical protein